MGRGIRTAAARTRLDRGPHRRDPVSLGEGRAERYAEVVAEFVRLKVDIILAGGTEAPIAAMQATSVIPIVFPTAGDPVSSGLVASLARPGGNVSGLSNLGSNLAGKKLGLFREVFPGLRSAITSGKGFVMPCRI
jgi:putative ABC transport system substrate-binding protein